MNISTSGSISAKKNVIGSRRMCTASLRATDRMRCSGPVNMGLSILVAFRARCANRSLDHAAPVARFERETQALLRLRPRQGHEHVFEARIGLMHLVARQAQLLD